MFSFLGHRWALGLSNDKIISEATGSFSLSLRLLMEAFLTLKHHGFKVTSEEGVYRPILSRRRSLQVFT